MSIKFYISWMTLIPTFLHNVCIFWVFPKRLDTPKLNFDKGYFKKVINGHVT